MWEKSRNLKSIINSSLIKKQVGVSIRGPDLDRVARMKPAVSFGSRQEANEFALFSF